MKILSIDTNCDPTSPRLRRASETILAIDTSCDETCAAVTQGTRILSNIVWSQASLHAKFGGVYPSLAQREHEARIDWVINNALKKAFPKSQATSYQLLATKVDAIAVTIGPGLSIALGVGIQRAKQLSSKYKLPILPVNHVEGHLLSTFAQAKSEKLNARSSKKILNTKYLIHNSCPFLGLVVSGGTTQLVFIEKIGKYKILATTMDDALGEALDKAARLLGLGYPGGAILERMAREGNPNTYPLPIPMLGRENEGKFSYSGLKTALVRLVTEIKDKKGGLAKTDVYDLAASFQRSAFEHLIRVTETCIRQKAYSVNHLLLGGGVAANIELRRRLRQLCQEHNMKLHLPYTKTLCGDNAAMIGVAAYLNYNKRKITNKKLIKNIDRKPNFSINEV